MLRNEEQKSLPNGKEREEVQEEVVEDGLAFEVEKALSNFQLSWNLQIKEDVKGNICQEALFDYFLLRLTMLIYMYLQ